MDESREFWVRLDEYNALISLVRAGRTRLPTEPEELSATLRMLWAKGLVEVMADFVEPTPLGVAAVQAPHRLVENRAIVFDRVELKRAASAQ